MKSRRLGVSTETRAQLPEMEKTPVKQVNVPDLTKLSPEVQQGYRVYVENVRGFLQECDLAIFGARGTPRHLVCGTTMTELRKPMSFHQIGYKFNNYEYNSITEVVADIRLILENCYRYNGSNHWVSKLGSLRDKVSLEATIALRSDFIPAEATCSDAFLEARAIPVERTTPPLNTLAQLPPMYMTAIAQAVRDALAAEQAHAFHADTAISPLSVPSFGACLECRHGHFHRCHPRLGAR
ncbi:hypothetical protein OS493_011019 [Desmophyllum pertusum]|uniref:Bromo domain-containing protein n=1 Tax=Desmophyllum pertusum TaxID=174260 RepID=A0A9W9ZF44_9CNID|nr:hypothetical protein OS493_011019 [Desmophyllum pertusum]